MTNPEVIASRLQEIEENIILVEELREVPLDKFCGDPRLYKLAERCLELAIQALLDICHYITADNKWSRPKDNQQAILIMAEKNVLPRDFAQNIAPMAGFRNILVHEYVKIEPKIIYEHLSHLDDFRVFQKHILNYLKINKPL